MPGEGAFPGVGCGPAVASIAQRMDVVYRAGAVGLWYGAGVCYGYRGLLPFPCAMLWNGGLVPGLFPYTVPEHRGRCTRAPAFGRESWPVRGERLPGGVHSGGGLE